MPRNEEVARTSQTSIASADNSVMILTTAADGRSVLALREACTAPRVRAWVSNLFISDLRRHLVPTSIFVCPGGSVLLASEEPSREQPTVTFRLIPTASVHLRDKHHEPNLFGFRVRAPKQQSGSLE